MATIALSAAGMALGGSIGGSVLGISMAAIGRAAGAAIGRRLDQQLLGGGSEPVESGRVDRFRLTSAAEGADVQQVFGRMRVPGQVIWASSFKEERSTSGGGKGGPPEPEVTTYTYSVSLAIALCEGEINRVGRIWADGEELSREDLNLRVYHGATDQMPDPKIAAVEGLENTPAYRGTAYVVFEDLALGQFGNRIPQFTFEVMRAGVDDLSDQVTGVALIPGTGEYSLATSRVYLSPSFGQQVAINANSPSGRSDFSTAMDALEGELPQCKSVVLVVSWFGDDLRCGDCLIKPKVEQKDVDASRMPWTVSGQDRDAAERVPFREGAPVYGGTPADASVVQAISSMRARGLKPVFYPFILMEQLEGNTLINPYTGSPGQPVLPWRGRITSALASGVEGSPDGTALAAAEVAAFMGNADPSDFAVSGTSVRYTGAPDWGYRRFILHYAHLCQAAGGVDAFCIGSEMRGLTQIRGAGNSFPAVAALQALAADVRSILGPDCKISYAADWSEYHGYQPVGTSNKFFHLDPLWADENIDFIGIDNYMPLSDWRDAEGHADVEAGSIYNLDYLRANVAGGEGYDWFYSTPEARDAQRRTPITDGDGEPWVWRYKDFAGWWSNPHHDRIDGVRQSTSTAWIPESKPFWFTEFGCAAIDKGTNQPNKFLDPKSSESRLPYYSNGRRDDFMQMQYLKAVYAHFADPANNPSSSEFDGRMVDTARMHAWAWDARPYPFFPANQALWSDGDNYARGHWLNGRATSRSLASVMAEICERWDVTRYDVSRLYGVVRGYAISDVSSARAAVQPLMLAYGIEVLERGGVLVFRNRDGQATATLDESALALNPETDQSVMLTRSPAAETPARVQISYLDVDADYDPIASEAIHPDPISPNVTRSEFPLALTRAEGQGVANRWLQEARLAEESARFALPPSRMDIEAGDVVALQTDTHHGRYRIDRIEDAGLRLIEATRVASSVYTSQELPADGPVLPPVVTPVPVTLQFLDLPLLTGDEVPHAPFAAATAMPWPGEVALYSAPQDSGYALQDVLTSPATMGLSETPLAAGPVGIWDRQAPLEVTLVDGALGSVDATALFAGANTLAIGDGTPDFWEIIQFQYAEPVGQNRFALHGLLRGQAGSRGLMPDVWPVGSRVVLLDGVPAQITLPSAARGITRHFRYGPAKRPMSDESFLYASFAFQGNGLRPYPVAHLRAKDGVAGLDVSWIRCGRIDGDVWTDGEIPLGEDEELYRVRIIQDGVTRRSETVTMPGWTYAAGDLAAEVGSAPYRLEVAQVSARFGEGLWSALVMQA
ncbi:glycoside hydrolase TIM-barrel-like domain-containing protein [Cognatiyoonia sp. IB215446]|uniref:baseplate multidomain protein megatron n=1 Tax=Cognatiyoonia sp. IB215446 TaxID=3097355 RepID=UPI002A147553|nr:glycoside hydrolase TIM-barrel-like domain-containing protein [Cognatiyoonia sp. IB215446]MDX8349666.1 glycoside hydrolase TIM-barrel-like domain-containing protein [Cognatiyoonia sp. IB215446]